jgi:hypothetical protein
MPPRAEIQTLVEHSPIVEIGAGTGYWARLATEAGADIVAYDSRPPVAGRKKVVAWAEETGTYFPVRRGGPGMVRFHQDRTLFLCWPPHGHDMAIDSLRRYEGGNRHTLVTELSESGAGDEVIMSIAGHVSRAMLSRYSHVRMEAKRRALNEIATRQNAADEKRQEEAKRREQVESILQSPAVQ